MNKVLQIIIRARDATASTFQVVTRRMRAIRRVATDVAKGVAVVGASVGAAVTGLALLARRGGEVTNVQRAFTRVAGDSATALERLREATQGLVSDMDLMTGFNQAVALGSARNVEEFGRMSRAAIAVSKSLGIDAKYALDSLNMGIARNSAVILDNLGIVLNVDQANQRYAATLGKTVQQLTEAERREAFRVAALEEADRLVARLGEGSDTAGDATNRFWNQLKNLGDQVASLVASTPLVEEFFEKMIEGLRWLEGHLPRIVGNMAHLATAAWDAIGLGDPIAREAERQLRNIRGREGYGLEDARMFESQLTADLGFTLQRRGQLEAMGRERGWLDPDGSISLAVTGPGNDPEAMAFARQLTSVRESVQVMLRVIAGVRGDVENFLASSIGADGDGDAGGIGALRGVTAAGLLSPLRRSRLRLTTPLDMFGGIGLAREQSALPSVVQGFALGGAGEPGPELGIFADFSNMLAFYPAEAQKAAKKTKDATDDLERAGATAVAAFGAMAEAAVEGSEFTARSVVNMITEITRSLPGVGGFAGAVIGAVGGVFGALVSRGGRNDPVPVRLASVDDAAARKLEPRREGPDRVTLQLIDPRTGQETARIEHDLRRRTRTDAVPRFTDGGV